MSKHEISIAEGAGTLRTPGEEIVWALVAFARGSFTAAAAGLAPRELGRRWSNKNNDVTDRVGLAAKRGPGLALTNCRLVTLDLATSLTGSNKQVKPLPIEVPVDQVNEVESEWNSLTITDGDAQFKLECTAPAAVTFVWAFADTKAA